MCSLACETTAFLQDLIYSRVTAVCIDTVLQFYCLAGLALGYCMNIAALANVCMHNR